METLKERTTMNQECEYYKCPWCKNVDKSNIPYGVCYECASVGPKFVETLTELERESFLSKQQEIKEKREKGIMLDQPVINNDKIIWKKDGENFLSDEIIVTEHDGIGINCGGHVIVLPVRKWHELGQQYMKER